VEKEIRQYDIHFLGLKVGEHQFKYKIDENFFNLFPESIFKNGNCDVSLLFDKQHAHFVLDFKLKGSVDAECHRCTADLKYPIFNENKLYVKFEDERQPDNEETDEVMYISRTESTINVAQLIYEYINLSLPMVINCDFLEEQFKNCNQEVLKKLNEASQEATDDRWQQLKKISFK
jgi:uncharacterized protein